MKRVTLIQPGYLIHRFIPAPARAVSLCLLLGALGSVPAFGGVGTVVAWGYEVYRQTSVPSGLTNAVGIATSFSNCAALKLNGELAGWGDYPVVPARLNSSNVVAVAGGGNHYLVLTGTGMVDGWGAYWGFRENMPPEVSGATNLVAIAAGSGHNLVLKSDGSVLAWGYNAYGDTTVPAGLNGVVAIACGTYHRLALKSDGKVVAWGAGTTDTGSMHEYGQAVVPTGLSNVVAIAAGGFHSLALKSDGTVVAWGAGLVNTTWPNFGQSMTPSDLSNVVAIAGGSFHSLALKSDGTIAAWGTTFTNPTNAPDGLSNVVAIASGPVSSACLAIVGTAPPVLGVPLTRPTLTGGVFSVSFPSQCDRVYRLEYKTSLTDPGWTALPLAAGTRDTLTLADPSATAAQRFYRVRQW